MPLSFVFDMFVVKSPSQRQEKLMISLLWRVGYATNEQEQWWTMNSTIPEFVEGYWAAGLSTINVHPKEPRPSRSLLWCYNPQIIHNHDKVHEL